MYITSILFYLSWPALIALSYWVITLALKRYEKISESKVEAE
jgi:hypothetical protein